MTTIPSAPGITPESSVRSSIRGFWVVAGLIALLGAALMARDIDRPFYGLHSVDQAHNAWLARSHVAYGLAYTHGFPTFAVGDPPAASQRYLDHPPLYALLDACSMRAFGVNTWALRLSNILATVVALLLFLRIVRRLTDDATALIAGLVFVQLPIITYFGINQWLYPLCFLALWHYLVLIAAVDSLPPARRHHRIMLVVLLFVIVQVQWQGLFFAVTFWLHFICRALHRRERPNASLLTLLTVVPGLGFVLNFVVLAAGDNWNFRRLIELFLWRAGSGERESHLWIPWLGRIWEFALTNFTWIVLVIALSYLTVGQWLVRRIDGRRLPQFWLFFLPALLQTTLLKGVVWEHQWWQRPLVPLFSLSTALGVQLLADLLRRLDRRLSQVAIVLAIVAISLSTFIGTDHYFSLRYYYPERLQLFESLQSEIPPDQGLLSFESYLFDQKPGVKPAAYRPEVGWHLNREIVVARTIEEIATQARSGRFPFYLMPSAHPKAEVNRYLAWLGSQLRNRYAFRQIRAEPDQWLFELGDTDGSTARQQALPGSSDP